VIGASTWHSKYYLIVSFITAITIAACTENVLTEPPPPGNNGEKTEKQYLLYLTAFLMLVLNLKMTYTEIIEWKKNSKTNKTKDKKIAVPVTVEREGPHTPGKCCCYVFSDRRRYSYFRYTRRIFLGITNNELEVEKSVQSCIERYFTGDNDAFYFPQRLWTAFVLSLFAQSFIFYTSINQFNSIFHACINLANTALQTSFLGSKCI
jgi:hypothetical protein